jgi:prepilin-type N-terminal cleavage/methylation domain-containing protein
MRQRGFTLVEIAIVLVIVGLLLAGIIQGSALINSGTAKNIANELKTIPIYIYNYQDKFRALPGDDPNAAAHTGGTVASASPVGNGRIEGAWNTEETGAESYLFWQHIRRAGFASGATETGSANYLTRNASGGRVGVSSEVPIIGMAGGYFACSGAILGKYVRQIDTTLDDGEAGAGNVRAAIVGTRDAVTSTAIAESQSYDVCMAF